MMADIKKELNDIKNAVYGREVRSSIHDGIKKINEESEESKQKAEEAHEITQDLLDETFDSAALEANFEQRLNDEIANLQPEWTGFKNDVTTQLAHTVKIINVKEMYGAKGDGVADDTLAFQNAFNDLESGDTLFIPKGEYRIVHQGENFDPRGNGLTDFSRTSYMVLKNKNNITIQGENGSKLVTDVDVSSNSLRLFSFYGCENILIDRIEVDFQAFGRSNALDLGYETWAEIIGFYPLFENVSRNVEITNCVFRINHPDGSYPGEPHDGKSGSTRLVCVGVHGDWGRQVRHPGFTFKDNVVYDTTARVVWTHYVEEGQIINNRFLQAGVHPTIRILGASKDFTIQGNTIDSREDDGGYLILIDLQNASRMSENFVIQGNRITSARATAMLIRDVDNSVISDNIITTTNEETNKNAIEIESRLKTCTDITVANNLINNFGRGVILRNGCESINISNNNIIGSKLFAIVAGGTRNSIIESNIIKDTLLTAIAFQDGNKNLKISNNQIINTTEYGIDFDSSKGHEGFVITNNVFNNSGSNDLYARSGFETEGIFINGNTFLNNTSGERPIFNTVVRASMGAVVSNNIFKGNTEKIYYHTDTLRFNNVVDGILQD